MLEIDSRAGAVYKLKLLFYNESSASMKIKKKIPFSRMANSTFMKFSYKFAASVKENRPQRLYNNLDNFTYNWTTL